MKSGNGSVLTKKHHSTVRDACRLAEKLSAKHLVLWHTEDKDLARRKERYLKEGQPCFSGKLYVPEDGKSFLWKP